MLGEGPDTCWPRQHPIAQGVRDQTHAGLINTEAPSFVTLIFFHFFSFFLKAYREIARCASPVCEPGVRARGACPWVVACFDTLRG